MDNILNLAELSDFKLDPSKIPSVQIRSIHIEGLKGFEDHTFDFSDGKKCKPFVSSNTVIANI